MNIIVWNIRGSGGDGKRVVIRNLVMKYRFMVLGFLEIKYSNIKVKKSINFLGII